MRTSRLLRVLVLPVLAVAAVGLVAPASAAPPPMSGPMLDSTGTANGCTASVDADSGSPYVASQIVFNTRLSCPASADIHYGQVYSSLYEVNPDGTWRTVYPQQMISWQQDASATRGQTVSGLGCTVKGPHTYVYRSTYLVRTAKGQDPYKLEMQGKFSINCIYVYAA